MVFGGDVRVAATAYGASGQAGEPPKVGLEDDSLDGAPPSFAFVLGANLSLERPYC